MKKKGDVIGRVDLTSPSAQYPAACTGQLEPGDRKDAGEPRIKAAIRKIKRDPVAASAGDRIHSSVSGASITSTSSDFKSRNL